MPTPALPTPEQVAEEAARILDAIHGDPEYQRLLEGCVRYDNDWQCAAGVWTISRWNVRADAAPLIEEALRALALKGAVYKLTGDVAAAELPIARPVDEVTHAVLAQRYVTECIACRAGIAFIHMTDTEQEAPPYRAGGYTHTAYTKAWGQPPARYWLDADEHARRAAVLDALLSGVGVHDLGRSHTIAFDTALPA
ncbi:hypothetical protein DPM19_12140 [Actinomadura craniellae]|uniref:Uncharacterized protein n=1 Tax=Actinomadura craniellae TaxID=2231787 RepID=A0A365H8H8_9ACTN|nr:hypothetical protein [Actinomadura craniellae]RAY15434.1 hypothetical protein DPM19_12140 [Actinomadura craniellae]